jgi:putative flippase GtrA
LTQPAILREGAWRIERASYRFIMDLLRYGGVSLVALVCDCALLLMLAAAGLHYLVAAAISFAAGIGVAYGLSVRFVFADRRDTSRLREVMGFLAVGIGGLLLTQGMMFLFVTGLSMDVALAKLPTTACVFAFNFLARRSLVFGRPRPALV